MSAAAFHLAGYAARSYSMLPIPALAKNLASPERALGYLLRRDLLSMRQQIIQWHADPAHADDSVAARLLNSNDEFGSEDAAVLALTTYYYRGLGLADTALVSGNNVLFETALAILQDVTGSAAQIGNIPGWWVATLTSHLFRDLWDQSLFVRLPSHATPPLPTQWAKLRRDFIAAAGNQTPSAHRLVALAARSGGACSGPQ
jgi:hypothetical protein